MDSEQQRLLDLALTWQPFGGPPEDEILIAFGISAPVFRYRVRRILAAPKATGPGAADPILRCARTVLRSYLEAGDYGAASCGP
ncbi:hypothetical protein [Nocardia abscessus]|uniref:DUF3263 domain-containing protein n=1 Tax=Nocardia abscessus TaxID=120957 RepID=A0ABS0C3X0_9NOCA|nr:hypothetical protein [Nocardia abscessus]MBF6225085.1 hypothetical protein [Nocardia abscessus]